MGSKNSCTYNEFVLCISGKCGNCGWNPANTARRLETAREDEQNKEASAMKEQLKKMLLKSKEEEDKESEAALTWAISRCE